jgi:hypothetical protein
MDTKFYIIKALTAGDKKVQNLYNNLNRPLSQVEMRLITRLYIIDERLSREEEDNLGFSNEARELRRDYRKVNRLLAKVCNHLDKHHEWLLYVDFRQFDRWL